MVADVNRTVNALYRARLTRDGVPLTVQDEPTTVTMPVPSTSTSTRCPVANTEPGTVSVIAAVLVSVTTLPASLATRV